MVNDEDQPYLIFGPIQWAVLLRLPLNIAHLSCLIERPNARIDKLAGSSGNSRRTVLMHNLGEAGRI
jgi:hypothetical protein